MHTITGRLSAAELVITAGLASVYLTIAQDTRYARQTVCCAMTYGSTPQAHAAAALAVEQSMPGDSYTVHGATLAALESQVWLLGVDRWTRRASSDLPTADVLMHARLRRLAGEAHA